MNRLHLILVIAAWTLVVACGLVGIASIFLAIWQQSDQWGLTAFACLALALLGGIGATALMFVEGR